MTKLIKIMFLSLLMVLTLSLLIVGCGEKETSPATTVPAPETTVPATATPALSQQELQKVLADSVLAQKKIDSYKFNMDMDMAMEITGGDEPVKMNMVSTMRGASSQAPREMQMTIDISMDLGTVEADTQHISMEMYVLADSLYIKMDIPPLGQQWLKMPFSEELKEMYNLDMVDQQLAPLESVTDLKFLRYETLDGSECYVLAITPDMQEIMSWVGKELPAEVDMENLDQLSKIFKRLSYTVWIARDTGFLKNLDARIRLEMNADQFAKGEEVGFEYMMMDITMTMKMYDHNKPVSIILPAEAQNAMEIPVPDQK